MLGRQQFISPLLKRFDLSGLYFNRYGVKTYNQLLCSDHLKLFVVGSEFSLPTSELHLGFDGLNDSITLLNTKIASSPHSQLVSAIESGAGIATCDYVRRITQGTLDFRPAMKVSDSYLEYMCKKFLESKSLAEQGLTESIKVFHIAGKHYIADGKHRAATFHLLRREVPCVDITPAIYDSFYRWVYQKMKRRGEHFTKHLHWLDQAYIAST